MVAKIIEKSRNQAEDQLKRVTEDQKHAKEKILEIFQSGDANADDELTRKEFFQALSKPDVMRFLHEVGVDVQRADSLFDVLDYDDSGKLSANEFVDGVMVARGEAQSKDVLELQCTLWRFDQAMNEEMQQLREDAAMSIGNLGQEVDAIKESITSIKKKVMAELESEAHLGYPAR